MESGLSSKPAGRERDELHGASAVRGVRAGFRALSDSGQFSQNFPLFRVIFISLFIPAQVDAENCSLVFADVSQCVEWGVDDETAGLEQEELFIDSNGCFSTPQLQTTLQYQHYTQVCLK